MYGGTTGTWRFCFPQGTNCLLSRKGGGQLRSSPVEVLQLELSLSSFGSKPPGTFLGVSSTNSLKRVSCIGKSVFVKHKNSLDASAGHRILGNRYIFSNAMLLFCMFV